MKNAILAAIYYTLGMSAQPQNHQNWTLLEENIVTKCIMKASLQKRRHKVTNMSKNCVQKGEFFEGMCPWESLLESSWSLPGFRNDSRMLQDPKMLPRAFQNDPKVTSE